MNYVSRERGCGRCALAEKGERQALALLALTWLILAVAAVVVLVLSLTLPNPIRSTAPQGESYQPEERSVDRPALPAS
jgi:hypothetical protein